MEDATVNEDELVVVAGADERYSIGIAVTIRSALQHLDKSRRVRLYVLDGGIESDTRQDLLRFWEDPRLQVEWISADMDSLRDLITDGYLNHTTYLRLLIPQILPSSTKKVLYLDSDLLIRKDLGMLWDEELGDHAILAGQETSTPYVDSKVVFVDQPLKYSKLGTTSPVRNYRELGMNPTNKVFNAGILLINLEKWRSENIPMQARQCLAEHREHVLFCDQYALNVVLANSWRELDTRWNQTASCYIYENAEESPFDVSTYDKLMTDPWICHFTSQRKPWHHDYEHPYKTEFLSFLEGTRWMKKLITPQGEDEPGTNGLCVGK
jgi:lipopolysaccharide biosynthesis glycosyltransferase